MSGELQVSGGAGGVTARYDDMLTYASVLDAGGDDARSKSIDLGGLAADGDLLSAAVLCPGEVAGVEAAITGAAAKALLVGGELEVVARWFRTSAHTFRTIDEQLANAEELLWTGAGWAAGVAGPGLLLTGVGLTASVLATNPALAALLYQHRDELPGALQETLYDNPWMLEALTRMAPGMVQGGAFSLSALLPGGPLALSVLTGGQWPSGDYTSSVAGLLALANQGGLLQDTGDFTVERVEDSPFPVDLGEHSVETLFDQQGQLAADPGRVQIITIDGEPPSYVVQIPGTQDWAPQRGDNPVDLTTNVNLMAGRDTVLEGLVADAIRSAHLPPGSEVMLTGHSQGGITAMNMAADPALREELHITSVVTGGSPVGRVDVPDSVSVLSLEHEQDAVPMLDGTDNPDRPNWVTVRRELSDAEAADESGRPGLAGAHATGNYASTGAAVDASTDPSIQAWRERNARFLGSGTITQYQITQERP